VVLIVSALAARPSGPAPALVGAGIAAIVVLSAGAWLRRPLTRLPETELKWGVGVLLSAFGVFFAAEGLHVRWLGADAAILYIAVTLAAVSQLQAHRLAGQSQTA
jgi:Ca2+/H+ antiporter, TMEM165/GDT1 family